jgi:hypothetical protein
MPNALEPINKLAEFTFEGGYISSAAKQLGTGHLAKGSENVMLTGTGKTQVFKGMDRRDAQDGGGVMQNVVETFASLGDATESTKYGSVFNVFAALFYIGAGHLRLAGESLGVNATSTLSILIKRSGSYTAEDESGPWDAGLAQPSAPIIRAVEPPAGLTGKVNGVVSVAIWRIRRTTGARSIKSLVSNLVGATNNAIAIPFPLADLNGQDAWGIGVTRHGEGAVGSHFILQEVLESEVATSEVDGQERTIAVEWRDGDLTEFAPTRDYPPPAGLFAGTLEDVAFVDGAYADAVIGISQGARGSGIAPSEPGRPESFSPDTVVFTNDTPTALVRGDGLYWRFGRNSLSVIRYVGGLRPLSVEPVWNGTGIEHQNQAVIADGGRLYVWNEVALRMGPNGMPDGEFANNVADDLAACTNSAKKVLGWDGRHKVVCFCYEKTIFPYFTALGRWGAPIDLTGQVIGNIQSCVTENNKLLISTVNATTDYLYEFNVGNGTTMQVMTGWVAAPASIVTIHSVMCSVRADNTANPIVIEIFADGDDSSPVSTDSLTPPRTGYQALVPIRPNVQDCESFAVKLTITSEAIDGDAGIETVSVHGEGSSIML